MAIKRIRLTESELTNLIRRIVEDTEATDDFEMERGDDMAQKDAIEAIADYLENEVLPELSSREIRTLERKVEKGEDDLQENIYEEEDEEDLSSRKSARREKMMIRGGLGMAATGAVLALGEFMGYSEFEITSMLHDLNNMANLGKYTGPVTVYMVFAGLALALKGLDKRVRRIGK